MKYLQRPLLRLLRLTMTLAAVAGLAAACSGKPAPKTEGAQVQATPIAEDWTCPMHHQVHSDHPGDCPICGMTLVQRSTLGVVAEAQPASQSLPAGLSEVSLSPEQLVLAHVETAPVRRRALIRTISAPGRITFDEARLAEVTARTEGRIERLYVATTGGQVREGRPMAAIYSPDLVSTAQEYVSALKAEEEVRSSHYAEVTAGARSLTEAARQRLKLWGLTDAQIAAIGKHGAAGTTLDLVAPRSGTVVKKLIQPGQYVRLGDPLFEIADLSRVWMEADVFESDLAAVKVGQWASITTPSFPGRTFKGAVTFVSPFLGAESRSVKVRVELPNSSGLLKPDMYVTATLAMGDSDASRLTVPASAVIGTGTRQIVYVQTAQGRFRPRAVTLGSKADDSYPVISGLREGETVAVSGGFLLDASSQIQAEGSGHD